MAYTRDILTSKRDGGRLREHFLKTSRVSEWSVIGEVILHKKLAVSMV